MDRRLRLALSGSCALLAAVLCALYGQHVQDEANRVRSEALERYGGEVVSLVVATEGLEAGDVVDRSNVAERDWLADLAPTDAVIGLDSVMGSEVTVPVAEGVPLTALNFRDGTEAVEVPDGRVALSIPVTDKLGLPAATASGTTLAAYEVSDEGARLVTEDAQVLRVPGEQTGVSLSLGAVTLAVRPEDVAQVLSASAQGSLRLALPADDDVDLTQGEEKSAPSEALPESSSAEPSDGVEGDEDA